MAFDAASYLVMALSLWSVRDVSKPARRPARRCSPSARGAPRGAGFRAVTRLAATNAVLRDTTIMFALFNVGESALLVFLPHRALQLGLGTGGYGYLVAAGTAGELLAALLLTRRGAECRGDRVRQRVDLRARASRNTLRIEMKVHGGALIMLTRPGIVVDADFLAVRYTDLAIGSGLPVTRLSSSACNWLAACAMGVSRRAIRRHRQLGTRHRSYFVSALWHDSNMCSPGQAPREQVLAELAATDPPGLPTAALMEQVSELASFADQINGELARRAAALDTDGRLEQYGYRSAAAFLRMACGRSPGHAGELVAAGRGLVRLPATDKALATGNVTFDQALVVTRTAAGIEVPVGTGGLDQQAAARAATEAAERVLLDAAADGVSVGQLRQLGEEITYRTDPDAAEERERRRWERRYLSFGLTLDHTGTLSGACGDAVSFETIRTAADAFGPPGGQLDNRSAAQRRLDGLAAACRVALDTGTAPTRHGAAPHISILVHDQTLTQATRIHPQQPQAPPRSTGTTLTSPGIPAPSPTHGPAHAPAHGAPPARTGHGQMLTATQVLALCCGAEVTAIHWEDGLPLNVGRAARTEPPALRKALEARDRTCRWPGCQTPGTWCTAHHIGGWADGASTSLDQMTLLCHAHHAHFIHLHRWTITGDPCGTLHFTHPVTGLTLHSPLPGKATPPGEREPRAP